MMMIKQNYIIITTYNRLNNNNQEIKIFQMKKYGIIIIKKNINADTELQNNKEILIDYYYSK